jgi:hypothetical protein
MMPIATMKAISKTTKITPKEPIRMKIAKSFLLQMITNITNKKKAV